MTLLVLVASSVQSNHFDNIIAEATGELIRNGLSDCIDIYSYKICSAARELIRTTQSGNNAQQPQVIKNLSNKKTKIDVHSSYITELTKATNKFSLKLFKKLASGKSKDIFFVKKKTV